MVCRACGGTVANTSSTPMPRAAMSRAAMRPAIAVSGTRARKSQNETSAARPSVRARDRPRPICVSHSVALGHRRVSQARGDAAAVVVMLSTVLVLLAALFCLAEHFAFGPLEGAARLFGGLFHVLR